MAAEETKFGEDFRSGSVLCKAKAKTGTSKFSTRWISLYDVGTYPRRKMSTNSLADEKARFSAKDSLACKYSACKMEYFQDPYIEKVHTALNHNHTIGNSAFVRRSPIIHRGYYARFECFSAIMHEFLQLTADGNRQIVFLGGGFDTSPLLPYHEEAANLRTFEVDFPEITNKKLEVYRSIPEISSLLEKFPVPNATNTTVGPITLIGQDLRRAKPTVTAMIECGLDVTVPTLILSECVLVYMDKEASVNLCSELAQTLQGNSVWATYDMINPSDIYGRNMIRNLQSAGFEIPGLQDFPTLEDQKNRFLLTGWTAAHSCSMRHYYDKLLAQERRDRLFALEMLDEVEEWNILMEHYSLTLAARGDGLAKMLGFIPASL